MNPNETFYEEIAQIGASPNSTSYNVCMHFLNINSDGIWGNYSGDKFSPLRSSLPVIEMQLIVIFVVTQLCHFILKHLGCPALVSQMLAGLILGPSLRMGSLNKYKKMLFPYGSEDILATFSSLGYAFFMFLAGVQMDFTMITRTGRRAWTIAFTMTAMPIALGYYHVFSYMPLLYQAIGNETTDLFVTFISHSITSFAVIANLLSDLKILNSELGRLALSTALVSDMLSTCMTSLGTGIVRRLYERQKIMTNILSLFAFFVLIPLLFRPAMRWIIRQTPQGRPVKEAYIYSIIAMVLCMGMLAILLDQEFYLGAFILGLAVPEGAPLGTALVKKLELFGTWFLLPVFVTTCMMKADLSLEYTQLSIWIVSGFVLGAHLVKMIACLVLALWCKMSTKDALALAIILNCKGVVEVCSYNAMYDKKNINAQTYGMLMVSVMIIASIVPVTVKYLYDPSRKYAGFQKRNIISSRLNTDLRMVCCIHKQFHIAATIDFLDIICPTEDNTITIDALHLVELVGRFSPIFISHRRQGSIVSGVSSNSYSENLNLAFSIYEHEHLGVATVNTYTAISPVALMHEDVCYLALDKLSSVIILPFHRRVSKTGEIEEDDKNIR
ncbi:hypothetical protein L6164_028898 [Bauhinia variegata]|uniref:Uncharacterized protein n=1 Tax=Bauhinia variegata TaxID=167791 RepID=A0ACB9L7K2_BAUVA|nr:hypothetical protein L6164_028898 [Bauhinia variegata]